MIEVALIVTTIIGLGLFAFLVVVEEHLHPPKRLFPLALIFTSLSAGGLYLNQDSFSILAAASVAVATFFFRAKALTLQHQIREQQLDQCNSHLISCQERLSQTIENDRAELDKLREECAAEVKAHQFKENQLDEQRKVLDFVLLSAGKRHVRETLALIANQIHAHAAYFQQASDKDSKEVLRSNLLMLITLFTSLLRKNCQNETELNEMMDPIRIPEELRRRILSEFRRNPRLFSLQDPEA